MRRPDRLGFIDHCQVARDVRWPRCAVVAPLSLSPAHRGRICVSVDCAHAPVRPWSRICSSTTISPSARRARRSTASSASPRSRSCTGWTSFWTCVEDPGASWTDRAQVNSDLYPLKRDERFTLALAPTLYTEGESGPSTSTSGQAPDANAWRNASSQRMNEYEYIMCVALLGQAWLTSAGTEKCASTWLSARADRTGVQIRRGHAVACHRLRLVRRAHHGAHRILSARQQHLGRPGGLSSHAPLRSLFSNVPSFPRSRRQLLTLPPLRIPLCSDLTGLRLRRGLRRQFLATPEQCA